MTILAGQLNLGGSLNPLPNPVAIAELAVDKQATTLLLPVNARRDLNDLPDELWTKVTIEHYRNAIGRILRALSS